MFNEVVKIGPTEVRQLSLGKVRTQTCAEKRPGEHRGGRYTSKRGLR